MLLQLLARRIDIMREAANACMRRSVRRSVRRNVRDGT